MKNASIASIGPTVTSDHLAVAIKLAAPMGVKDKETVCDRIYAAQPNLLASVLAQRALDVTMPTIDVVLNILIVLQLAVEESGQTLATVAEADQERELERFTAAVRFTEGLTGDAVTQSFKQTTAYKREKFLLAYVVGKLQCNGLLNLRDERSKYPVLTAINLVNCIATAKRVKT